MQVEKLQAKYEVVSKKHHGGPEDVGPDGQPHSQAYYVIKAAQEREELQREVSSHAFLCVCLCVPKRQKREEQQEMSTHASVWPQVVKPTMSSKQPRKVRSCNVR